MTKITGKIFLSALIVMTIVFASFITQAVCDDEVVQSINEAVQHYKAGRYAAAADALEYASQLIRQKSADTLTSFLPEPLSGWTAGESTSQAVGTALLGGGVYAERDYRKGNSSIIIRIITESPVMESIMMMLTNPNFASASGGRLERIKGHKAVVRYDSSLRSGSINIIVANTYLVTLDGQSIEKQDIMAYVEAIAFDALKKNAGQA